jgi:hypothetical protein
MKAILILASSLCLLLSNQTARCQSVTTNIVVITNNVGGVTNKSPSQLKGLEGPKKVSGGTKIYGSKHGKGVIYRTHY